MAVSDGVHDNLHPQMLALSPLELKLDFQTWEEAAKVVDIELVAAKYRVQCLSNLISELDCTPQNIVEKITAHCLKTTASSRAFMLANPGKRLPNNYKTYPGKMDHTTCVCFRVGFDSSNFSRSR